MVKKKGKASQKSEKPAKNTAFRKLPSVWQLTQTVAAVLWQHKKTLGGIILVYAVLDFILVQGLTAATDTVALKQQLNNVFSGNFSSVAAGLGVFTILVSSSGATETTGSYHVFLLCIASLAIIWALRQLFAGVHIRIRDAYYNGMAPLIPFILIVMLIGLQLVPMLIGTSVYSIVVANGIAVHLIEQIGWLVVCIVLGFVSLYFIASSAIALYIATLPDMTPLKALRSAKDLVRDQRWAIVRKLLYLPFALLVVGAIIMLPVIILLAPIAAWVFFLLSAAALVVIHAYMYVLYRELLDE